MLKTTAILEVAGLGLPSAPPHWHQPGMLSTNTNCSVPIWLDPAWQAEPDDTTLGEQLYLKSIDFKPYRVLYFATVFAFE